MPVEVDLDSAVLIIWSALTTQRTVGTVLRLVAGKGLLVAALVGFDPFSYLFHAFACRAPIPIGDWVIDKFVGPIGLLLISLLMTLVPVELIVLYIGGNALILQPLVILFAAITSIGRDIGRLLFKGFYVLLQMWDQCSGIGRIGMKAVGGNELVVGTDLHVIARF